MHQEVIDFTSYVKSKYPHFFKNVKVLDVGSLDINGNNRHLFTDCEYTGLDIIEGKNVDIVCPVHEFEGVFDTVISTEMLEHDKHWKKSIEAMIRLSKGIVIITAAGKNRKEHGTTEKSPEDSPATNDYYQNITKEMLIEEITKDSSFAFFEIKELRGQRDICFYGVKRSSPYK